MAAPLQHRGCSTAPSPPISSAHLRNGLLFTCSFSSRTPSFSSLPLPRRFRRVPIAMAVTKHKKKGKSSRNPPSRDWSYEHLMVAWDEAFERCCTDPFKASRIRDLAHKGLMFHGRGCVFVFHEIQTIPRGPGAGFTSKPPRSSRAVPDFVTLRWHAAYVPRHFLLDPTKAPLEQDLQLSNQHCSEPGKEIDVDELITDVVAAETVLEEDDDCGFSESLDEPLQIIDYSEQDAIEALATTSESPFLILDDSDDGLAQMTNLPQKKDKSIVFDGDEKDISDTQDPVLEAEMRSRECLVDGDGGVIDAKLQDLQGSEALDVFSQTGERVDNEAKLISQEMLFLSMKGMDVTRLLSLTMNVDFEAEKFRLGSRTAMVNMRTMDAGGEDPYNPEQDELVLLLHLVIDKRPAFGADVVIAYRDDMCMDGDSETDSWKLRLKYKL